MNQHSVEHPGARGGTYWVDTVGRVRYGTKPASEAETTYTPEEHRSRAQMYRQAAHQQQQHVDDRPHLLANKRDEYLAQASAWHAKADLHERAARGEHPAAGPPARQRRSLRELLTHHNIVVDPQGHVAKAVPVRRTKLTV